MLIDTDALLPRAELGHVALALAAVLSTYILSRWLRSESGDVRHFTVAYPEQAAKGWKGRLLWNPSLASDASDSLTKTINCVDPATYELIATVPADSAADIARKVEAASVAQRAWAETTFRQRRLVMRSLLAWVQTDMEEISKVAVRDSGKTMLDSAFGEIITTCSKLEWLIKDGEQHLRPEKRAGNLILSHKSAKVYWEPLGVVVACVSWNYPFHNAISPIIASIFAGNSIVLKCSEQVAWSSRFYIDAIRSCIQACGFDPDIVQLVVCYPEEAPALLEHPLVRHITFIGSEQVARKVAVSAAKNLVPCTMELGGKDPAIILPSADIKKFESTFMRATFQSVGQGCIASELFFVHSSLVEPLVASLTRRASALRLASSLSPESDTQPVDCGSMISDARFDDLERKIEAAKKLGARVVVGGGRRKHGDVGAFFLPTLIVDVTMDMEIAREEVFGPIMLILKYETVDEVVALANSSRYGLGASVYGRDQAQAQSVARRLECGMVSLNDFGVFYLAQSLPFGGCKASGYGRFGGPEGLRALCNVKAVMEDRLFGIIQTSIPPPVDYPVKSTSKSWKFVQGLVALMYAGSALGRARGLKKVIEGSI